MTLRLLGCFDQLPLVHPMAISSEPADEVLQITTMSLEIEKLTY